MKIMIICSTMFYDKVKPIKEKLEQEGYSLLLPNGYDGNEVEENYDDMTHEEYVEFFKKMYYESKDKISKVDAVLVLNYSKTKNGVEYKNYVGASTFLEMYEAFMQNKKIFMLYGYPDSMLYDEVKGFNPIILNGDLDLIKNN